MRTRYVGTRLPNFHPRIGTRSQRELDAAKRSSCPEARVDPALKERRKTALASRRFAATTSLLGFLFDSTERK